MENMKNIKQPLNQRGQLVVEALLLIVIGLGLTSFIIKSLRENEFVQSLTSKPWVMLSGMIECGTWNGCGPGQHPSTRSRNISYKTEDQ